MHLFKCSIKKIVSQIIYLIAQFDYERFIRQDLHAQKITSTNYFRKENSSLVKSGPVHCSQWLNFHG